MDTTSDMNVILSYINKDELLIKSSNEGRVDIGTFN
jgi:hypothetical protein